MCFISRQGSSSLSFILFTRTCNLLKSWQNHSTGCLSRYLSADSEETNSEAMLSNWAHVGNLMRLYRFFISILWKNEVAYKKEVGIKACALDKAPGKDATRMLSNPIFEHPKRHQIPLSFGRKEEIETLKKRSEKNRHWGET